MNSMQPAKWRKEYLMNHVKITSCSLQGLRPNSSTWRCSVPLLSVQRNYQKEPRQYRDVTGLNPVEVLTFSGFYTHKCINCFHNWEDHSLLDFTSAVQDMKFFIYNFTFIPHGLLRTHKWPAPNVSGFIPHLVRASHHYCKVTGSNPVEVLTFPGF